MSTVKKFKSNLPKDWIVRKSNNHPDRVYYFNVRTGKSSWTVPSLGPSPEPPSERVSNRNKRKTLDKDDDNESGRNANVSVSNTQTAKTTGPVQRKKLCAKRCSEPAKPAETPQMQAIRQKILQKQSKQQDVISKKSMKINAGTQAVVNPKNPTNRSASSKGQNTSNSSAQKNNRPVQSPLRNKGKSETVLSTSWLPIPKISGSRPQDDSRAKEALLRAGKVVLKSTVPSKTSTRSSSSTCTSCDFTSTWSNSTDLGLSLSSSCTSHQTIHSSAKSLKQRSNLGKSSTQKGSTSKPSRSNASPGKSSSRKNLAKERLENLRKSLSSEREFLEPGITRKVAKKILSLKKTRAQEVQDNHSISNTRLHKESIKTPDGNKPRTPSVDDEGRNHNVLQLDSPPNIYKNAEVRIRALQKRLVNDKHNPTDQSDESNALPGTTKILAAQNANKKGKKAKTASTNRSNEHHTTLNSLIEDCKNELFYEEMDWEPIEDEKMIVEIQEVRKQIMQLYTEEYLSKQILNDSSKNGLALPQAPQSTKEQDIYVVVDTNVFLSNLQVIEEIKDSIFENYKRPIIVVPWTVIQELDYIKDNKYKTKAEMLQWKARKAVNFLYEQFSTKHPRVKGQTVADATANKTIFEIECPDDGILQSCLQVHQTGSAVVLLSYDKNLCNKAMVHGIVTLGRDDTVQSIDKLTTNNKSRSKFDTSETAENSRNEDIDSDRELEISDDIFNETKAIMKQFLSTIVAKEMTNLYGEHWERYTIIRPPWSVIDVLKCALKHWIAAVSESFERRTAESIIKELLDIFNNAEKHYRKLKCVYNVLAKCNDLVQMVKQDKYQSLMIEACKSIKELQEKCEEKMKLVLNKKYQNEVAKENDNLMDEERVQNAFQYFHDIWVFTNNFCGLAADMVGMQHTITYPKPNSVPTIDSITQMQPTLVANLTRLIHVLNKVLDEADSLYPDHGALISLYEVLTNFMPDHSLTEHLKPLTPLQLYCCVKQKKEILSTGLKQFQDLNNYFCRMAEISS